MPRNQMKAVVGFVWQFYPQWDSAKVASMCEKLSKAAEEDGDELCRRCVDSRINPNVTLNVTFIYWIYY